MKSADTEKGSIMMEFSIISFLFIVILGFLFDVLIIYFKNQVLVHTVSRSARAFAINYPTVGTDSHIDTAVRAYINNNFFLETTDIVITSDTSPLPNSGLCRLEVTASWPNSCIFCFFPDIIPQAHGEAIIEDECLVSCS